MTKLFIVIKRKGSKRFLGAIPTKRGSTKTKLKGTLSRLRKGFAAKIVTAQQLKKIITLQRPKIVTKRRRKARKWIKIH